VSLKQPPIHPEEIRLLVAEVAQETGVSARDILGPSQTLPVARARHLCFTVAVDVMRATRAEVGIAMNRSDATVHEGTQRGRKRLLWDTEFRRVHETVSASYRDRYRLALIGELELMNRTIARCRKRAGVIAELLGLGSEEQRAEAAE
jgi:hypothetical protein